jgi:tRNA 5-methylaminomethyl-2-thiouridine biosynthesis bifunctional protein
MESCVQQLVDAWPLNLLGVHRLEFEGFCVTLTLVVGQPSTMLQRLSVRADAVVLPAPLRSYPPQEIKVMFGAATNVLLPQGKLVMPWSSASGVPDRLDDRASALWAQGAVLDGVWSHVAQATPLTSPVQREGHQHAVVVGGGFAGASVAYALSLRGWTVKILEPSVGQQSPHQGHLAAALTPMLTRDDDVRARLSRAGTLLAHHRWGHLTAEAFEPCGALQLSRTSGRVVDLKGVVAGLQLPEAWAKFVEAKEASAIAGLTLQRGGIHFPMAARVQPEAFINQLLSGVEISRRAVRVDRLLRRGNVWHVLDAAGQVLEEAPIVIVAAAYATQDILGASGLLAADARLRTMHQLGGEITYLPERAISGGPRCIVSGDGYVLPAVSGQCVTGSSYVHGADQVFVTSAGARENMQRTDGLLGSRLVESGFADSALSGWAGWRAVLPGRLPAIGAIDEEQTLWAVAGLASRGLTWSSLAGDLVAAALNGEPLPLETDIIDKISQI